MRGIVVTTISGTKYSTWAPQGFDVILKKIAEVFPCGEVVRLRDEKLYEYLFVFV